MIDTITHIMYSIT